MQLTTAPNMLMFETWDRDSESRTKIVLLRAPGDAGAVTLLAKFPYGNATSSLVISADEAAQLGADILKLVPDSLSRRYSASDDRKAMFTSRIDEQSGLTIRVCDTTQGDPYECGVRIEFMTESYSDSITLDFGFYAGHVFARALVGKA
jgi:hypothetical protein